ncbi:M20 family metallopeptidase [Microvirga terrae]|uniref:M20 family metallopeptidase n=1 Tax=Microvirga terrae TaxID=2740529 RepID=A0ABY5RSZ1_9HYPH|nr:MULTISPECIES: M20 aminoacylase family protein [Microvirga]MBQ0821951.1 amidohydrolase [Microvirga sp. HBU67558]UVF19444.1 M20 family metallopeptidase [Microvirga terrae]
MPIINRVADLADEIAVWRRDFHENPELLFDVHRTAGIVAEKLKSFGCDEVVTGLGRTGVVGVIKGRSNNSGKVIGLRADMDALPIEEATDVPHKSKVPGKMHACGHDGHTAMLLGAAKYLAETRNFDGTAVVIFQPAEEGGGGGNEMLKDGLMERFGVHEVYGMHNMPGIPVGQFAIRPGPMMAAADRFTITIEGKGGHAARPHDCIDPVVISAHVITALQTIASRSADPLDSVVVSVCTVKAGEAFNVIPQTAMLLGTVRTLSPEVRDLAETRIRAIVENVCAAFGAKAEVEYDRGYPVTMNDPDKTDFMAGVARAVAGENAVDTTVLPLMGAEDFSYMLEQRPGAYIFLGNGDTAGVHHPAYDFNDEASPYGVSLWAKIIETGMPAR